MQEKEVCWNITTNCNLNCLYCHRFLNIEELSLEENKSQIEKLLEIIEYIDKLDNIKKIKLIGFSYKDGIQNHFEDYLAYKEEEKEED